MRRASVVLSGGRPSARSLKTSTSWPPEPKSSTGPNCGSIDAADDQLVAVQLTIGCTVTPWKCSAPLLLASTGFADELERLAHRVGVREVELHAADIGLVRDRVGVELEHHREADPRRPRRPRRRRRDHASR